MSVKPKELLKTGMRVTLENGLQMVIVMNCCATANSLTGANLLIDPLEDYRWCYLDTYDDNLNYIGGCESGYDIVKIEALNRIDEFFNFGNSIQFATIWRRPTPKEMTIAEIEQALGYPIKVVKE